MTLGLVWVNSLRYHTNYSIKFKRLVHKPSSFDLTWFINNTPQYTHSAMTINPFRT